MTRRLGPAAGQGGPPGGRAAGAAGAPAPRPAPARSAAVAAAALTALAAALGLGAGTAEARTPGLTLIDNSNADSWLEIDRTGNLETGGGTAGSDHDGSAVDLMDTLVNPDPPGPDDESTG